MYGFKPGAKPQEKAPQGKKIEGPGSGTSDSIKTDIPKGSYIMPADSTQQIGQKALGKLGQPVPVNVSNGEYQMPPEQVHAVGVQALNQMRDATHMPVAAGFKPQKDGLYFADGGLIADAAQYWANDNEQFEAGNPSFGSRVVRALNPATSFGSAMGAMHTAAGSGDKTGMALAAAQAFPVFGAMRSVITPAMGAVKAARAMAPSAAQTGAAIAGSGAAGAMADAYGSPAAAAEPQQPGLAFSDMQREPNIPRREEPRLGFADGGSPAEEERRRLPGSPLAVTYGDMQRAPSRPQPSAPSPAGAINTATPPRPSAPAAGQPPAQEAGFGAATERAQQGAPVSFSSMQREPNVPRTGQPRQMPQGEPIGTSGVVGGFQAAGQRAAAGIQGATDQVAQAGRGFMAGGQAMTDQAATAAVSAVDAASDALTYLNRGDPVRDAANAIGGFFSRSAQQARGASYGGQPETEAAPQPVAAPPATTPPSAAPSAPAVTAPTQQSMQGPALGMRVSPTSAEGINRIDNAPGLKSPLFTNLPTGQAAAEMKGGTVNSFDLASSNAAMARANAARGGAEGQGMGFQPERTGLGNGVIGSGASDDAQSRNEMFARWGADSALFKAGIGKMGKRDAALLDASQKQYEAIVDQGLRKRELASKEGQSAADRDANLQRTAMQEAGANARSFSRDDIDRQRAEGEAQTRGFEVRGMQRVERLYQQLEAAKTPEERSAIAEQLRALSGKEAPNRFTVVPGGQEIDPTTNMAVTRPARVFNNQSGQFVDQQQGAQALPPIAENPAVQKIMQNTALSREERAAQIRALGYK